MSKRKPESAEERAARALGTLLRKKSGGTLDDALAAVLGCTETEDYRKKKIALIARLRREHPEAFKLDGVRKHAFEHMAAIEGTTAAQKLEDMLIMAFLLQQSARRTKQKTALASAKASNLAKDNQALLNKEINELYSDI